MKIGQFEPKTLHAAAPHVDRQAGPTKGAGSIEPSASVELSASAIVAAADDGTFDAAKVDRIASAIRDGQYKIDAGAIADKLIANAQELISRNSR